jgi:integrase
MSIRRRTWTSAGVRRESWVVDYRDHHGVRRHQTFATRRDAIAWETQTRNELAHGTHTATATSITVEEAFILWLEAGRADWERGTLEQRRGHLLHHVAPLLGKVRLAELTLPRINKFIADLRSTDRSRIVAQKVLANLKTAISYAQGQGLVAQNVARAAKVKASTRTLSAGPLRPGVDIPSKAELAALLEHASDRWRALITVLIFTGMRASEIRGLMWKNVDLAAGVLHVRQRVDAWGQAGPPKSRAGSRDIPLPPMVVNALRQARAPGARWVFANRAGKPYSRQNLQERVLDPLQVAAGVVDAHGKAKYSFHAFRHSAASLFIELGWSPKRLQTVLGHASIKMTFDRYGHLFPDPEADRAAMAKLEMALRVV